MSATAERPTTTPSHQEREIPPVVSAFLESAIQTGGLLIDLDPSQIRDLNGSDHPRPLDMFNVAFQSTHPRLFSPVERRNRIVRSYLTSQTSLDLSSGVDFTIIPNTVARESAHGVFFGTMYHSINGSSAGLNGVNGIDVAVKPYREYENPSKNYSRAWREFITGHIVAERGVRTIKPLCLVVDQKSAYIISMAERIVPLDDVTWEHVRNKFGELKSFQEISDFAKEEYPRLLNGSEGMTPEDEDLSYYLGVLADLGRTFADVHCRKIYPQDAQAKNFVMDAMTSKVFPIDWEHTRLSYPRHQDKESEARAATYGISQLLMSFIIPRSGETTVDIQGISGIGLYSPLIKQILGDLKTHGSSLYEELEQKGKYLRPLSKGGSIQSKSKNLDLSYSPGCTDFLNTLCEIMFYVYDLTFFQHYRSYGKENGMDPEFIDKLPREIKGVMLEHLKTVVPIYLEDYQAEL